MERETTEKTTPAAEAAAGACVPPVTFAPVAQRDDDIERLAALAHDIWFEYWPDRIGEAQTAYMVERFQSVDAIRRDMSEHAYEYWFILDGADGHVMGYTGGRPEAREGRYFISKIYLLPSERGKHVSRAVIAFYEQLCAERGLREMYLTVNKHNELGVRAYQGCGLAISDAVEKDIGSGFVMDDYIMSKQVAPGSAGC